MSREIKQPLPGRGRIQRLSGALIDQIAAGEVVERPASVVKELVENALDAGATRVRVEVRAGGRDWIAVSDDGVGMSASDVLLALERHATSKIASSDDLARIHTFGFRGEALPAIASVSRLRIRSRQRGTRSAVELTVEVGNAKGERTVGAPEGTRVEVADLFTGVPARRKFLKSATTEWRHVSDWLARSALALPGVHFDVQRDDRKAVAWPAAEHRVDRIAAVLGEEEATALIPVEREEGRARLHGFVSRPDRHRATLTGVYLFVNDRPVRDRLLQHALLDVYREVLPRGRFPSAVLFLEVPPESVDVNVHPAKWEVRFADPPALHRMMRHTVRDALAERRWIAPGADVAPVVPRAAGGRPARTSSRSSFGTPPATMPGASDWIFAGAEAAGSAPEPAGSALRYAEQRLLGQLLGTYLVLESDAGLLLIDQHAAHERVLYEQLRAGWRERAVERQGLLLPLTVELGPGALAALVGASDDVARLGFEVEPFGPGTVALRSVPALLAERDPADLVRDLADEICAAEAGPGAGPISLEAADRIFASLACHAARRKGDVLDHAEQRALLESVDRIPYAPTCPHGRPVAVPLDLAEIERRFARR